MKRLCLFSTILICAMVAQAGTIELDGNTTVVRSHDFGGSVGIVDVFELSAVCLDTTDALSSIIGGFSASSSTNQMIGIWEYLNTKTKNTMAYRDSATLTVYGDEGFDANGKWLSGLYKTTDGNSGPPYTNQAIIPVGNLTRDYDSHWAFTTIHMVPAIAVPAETQGDNDLATVTDGVYTGEMWNQSDLTAQVAIDVNFTSNNVVIAQIAVRRGEWATFKGVLSTALGVESEIGFISPYLIGYIPEPATMSLLGLGVLALLRRKSA